MLVQIQEKKQEQEQTAKLSDILKNAIEKQCFGH